MARAPARCEITCEESVNTADVKQRETTEEEILDWRFEQLLRVGYERQQARVLSQRLEVDLHQAVDLIGRGCPHDVALAILL
jgi:hypothetical protein